MKLTMKEWLKKEIEKSETRRADLGYDTDNQSVILQIMDWWWSLFGYPTNGQRVNRNEFIAVGGKLTAFKQVLDWIEKHE